MQYVFSTECCHPCLIIFRLPSPDISKIRKNEYISSLFPMLAQNLMKSIQFIGCMGKSRGIISDDQVDKANGWIIVQSLIKLGRRYFKTIFLTRLDTM